MNAAHPAPSTSRPDADPAALRDEFRRFMAGFAPEQGDTSPAAQKLRQQQNTERSHRAKAAQAAHAETSPVSKAKPAPSLPVEAFSGTAPEKTRVRRLPVVAPKPTVASRAGARLRAYRQNVLSLFLTEREVIEECPGLLPHMVPTVML